MLEKDQLLVFDFETIRELTTFVATNNTFKAEPDANDDLVMSLVIFAWAATQQYFKEIVNHDLRKQIQLENLNQYDDDTLPAPIIDDGFSHNLELLDGDLWEKADSGMTYSSFIRDMMRNL